MSEKSNHYHTRGTNRRRHPTAKQYAAARWKERDPTPVRKPKRLKGKSRRSYGPKQPRLGDVFGHLLKS